MQNEHHSIQLHPCERMNDRPENTFTHSSVQEAMRTLYDHYFSSKAYQQRYPEPNRATLDFLFAHGAARARHILDFGCGNGRYALALLQRTQAHLTGYDISEAALDSFRDQLIHTKWKARTTLLSGPLAALNQSYDMILMLFGVLSHIGDQASRQAVLQHLRTIIQPNGRLILSVPSLWRRRPLELLSSAYQRWSGRGQGVLSEPGNIEFTRELAGMPHTFFYHLYTVEELQDELQACGFETVALSAENVLPEWLVTQNRLMAHMDANVSRMWPASLGYGIRVAAKPI